MNLDVFQKAAAESSLHTRLIALHILGDPLLIENLEDYLNIAAKYHLSVELTTSGAHLHKNKNALFHRAIKQVNFSLDAIVGLDNFKQKILREIVNFCFHKPDIFINFRIQKQRKEAILLDYLKQYFTFQLNGQKYLRIAPKIFIDFREVFSWNGNNQSVVENTKKPACYGLIHQIGILSNGVVVPCCIDVNGIINLGNIKTQSLKSILHSAYARELRQSFLTHKIKEPLCQHCDYRIKNFGK